MSKNEENENKTRMNTYSKQRLIQEKIKIRHSLKTRPPNALITLTRKKRREEAMKREEEKLTAKLEELKC